MGLFSKKTKTCERCGKEYQVRLDVGEAICPECKQKEAEMRRIVSGYIKADEMSNGGFTYTTPYEKLQPMIDYKNELANRLRLEDFPYGANPRAYFANAGATYKTMSDDECKNVIIGASLCSVEYSAGAHFNEKLFAPDMYEGTVVDVNDVFAVTYTSDYKFDAGRNELIVCAVFTNDPYIRVFPMTYIGKLGIFEVLKSKKGRADVSAVFEALCPNLKYPVQDIKTFKKTIKQCDEVQGSINKKEMLQYISDLSVETSIFKTDNWMKDTPAETTQLLNSMGYVDETEVNQLIGYTSHFGKKFWDKKIAQFSSQQ